MIAMALLILLVCSQMADAGMYGAYSLPCYKYPSRGMASLLFTIQVACRDVRAEHWLLRGVALLCDLPK